MKFAMILSLAMAVATSASPFDPFDILTNDVVGATATVIEPAGETGTGGPVQTGSSNTGGNEGAPAGTGENQGSPEDPTYVGPPPAGGTDAGGPINTGASGADPTEPAPAEPTVTETTPAYPTVSGRAILPKKGKDIRAGYMAVPVDPINARAESASSYLRRSWAPTTTSINTSTAKDENENQPTTTAVNTSTAKDENQNQPTTTAINTSTAKEENEKAINPPPTQDETFKQLGVKPRGKTDGGDGVKTTTFATKTRLPSSKPPGKPTALPPRL